MTAERNETGTTNRRVTRRLWAASLAASLSVAVGTVLAQPQGQQQTTPPPAQAQGQGRGQAGADPAAAAAQAARQAQQQKEQQIAAGMELLPASAMKDPRVGLKPGLTDAGEAAKNMKLVGHTPKAPAFADNTGLTYANSDLAFQQDRVFQGNFYGWNFYDVEDPKAPQLKTNVICPGGQGDLSVYGHLLFMSVEAGTGRVDCGTQGVQGQVSPDRFRGIRIFDITDLANPKQVADVQTCRGSHTHTLIVPPGATDKIYVWGQGTSGVRSGDELAGCVADTQGTDPNTGYFSIDIIEVPLAHPEQAKIVNRPRIFGEAGSPVKLQSAGSHGGDPVPVSQCHDITTYPAIGLAAGACQGNGILLDISDPANPKRLDAVGDPNFAYWHSATFSNDGSKVLFSDEWGGGTQPRCRATDPIHWGADAIFDIGPDKKMKFEGYYKLPAPQTDFENCVAHNGSLIPVPGRDIMVQGWYQGGVSVFDFTDPAHAKEIAFFDRGPVDPAKLVIAGYWCGYWFDGHIYGSEIGRGLDIFDLLPSDQLSQNELAAAKLVQVKEFNPQHQQKIVWPANPVVARAYMDQLQRSKALSASQYKTIDTALAKTGTAGAAGLEAQAKAMDKAGGSAKGVDQSRFKALADMLRQLAK